MTRDLSAGSPQLTGAMTVLIVLLLLHTYQCSDVAVMTQRPLVVDFTSRSAQLSWAPVYSQTVSPARTYLIQKRRHDPDGPWDVQDEIHVSDNRTSYNVTGLRPFTAYSFRVISVNSVGRSSPSQPSYPIITGREVPSGRPVVIRTSTLGPASIEVVWRPPDVAEMNGEFIGHLISFRRRNESRSDWTHIDLPGNINSSISHVIDELLPFTDYLIRIQVRNMMGLGPYTVVRANTDEGVPEKPEGLTVGAAGSSWVDLTWRAPGRPNGVIVGYYLYYQFILDGENFTDSRVVSEARRAMNFNLTELEPNTEYKAWLFAKSGRHEGRPSDRVQFRTDVAGPAAPAVQNVSCVQDTSVQVHWRPAGLRQDPVDLYYVRYQRVEPATLQHALLPYKEVRVPALNDNKQLTLRLDNLTLDTSYDVQVAGAVFSRLNGSVIRRGPPSGSHRVRLQRDCEILQQMHLLNAQRPVWQLSSGMMAGVICASVAVLLTLMALIIWRRYFQATYNYLAPENKKRLSVVCSDWEADTFEGDGAPVAVQAFPKHVATLNENGAVGFSKEFEDIQLSSAADKHTSELSQRSENKAKNRYLNVLAYDHSRVPLEWPGSPGRDCYINANFIDGYQQPRAYIATQGPLPETYNSFWSMVWQHNVSVIVVITNIIEAGRRKCDQYWPDTGKSVYGSVDVTYLGEDVMATYTIRRFNVGLVKVKRPPDGDRDRIVYQYHYTCWPDSGIPHCRLPILSFVRKSSAANSDCRGPIIVHCSAGVGRTGTYIVLDAMLKMIRTTGTLNVYGFLKYIRAQRNFLVQTEEQYVFLHWALSDAVQMGETDIHSSFLARYLHNLRTSQHDVYPWYSLATQYRLITAGGLADTDAASVRHPSNLCKNRCQELVPAETSRVIISPRAGVECSDYINASWIVGFSQLKEFIITQHPLADTMADFWQMVWEHDVPVVVLLSPSSNENYTEFWPVENAYIECERFRVRFQEKTASGPCFIHEFLLTSHLDGTELSLRLVQCPDWPHGCVPLSRCLEAVETVRRCRQRQPAGPCVLVDRAGGLEASLFSCLSSLARQLEYEAHADVFQYARLCHQRRPGVWARPEDLLLLYRAVETLVSSDSPRQLQPPAASISQPDVTYTQHHMPKPILKKPGTLRRDRCAASSSLVRIPPDGMESCVLDICQS